MNDTLLSMSLVEWAAIAVMACAGSWMHFNIRPYTGDTPGFARVAKILGMFAVSSIAGAGVTPGVCEMYGWPSPFQRMIVAFFAALLAMPVCRGTVFVAESEFVTWLKQKFLGKAADDDAGKPAEIDRTYGRPGDD